MSSSAEKLLPKPEKPTPYECCGSGCVPCIYDYYYDALEKWEAQQKELSLSVEEGAKTGDSSAQLNSN